MSMTGFALSRGRLVEKHGLPFDLASEFVTIVTSDVPVSALERKRSALVVVKPRGLPACRVMAARTVGGVFASGKLAGVDIVVTSGAVFRRSAEINIFQAGFQHRWTMAVSAGYAAVSAEERKICFRMIEAVKFLPSCGRVAGFAARRRTVRTLRFHALFELTVMRIHVASRAGTILKAIFHGYRRSRGDGFVTIRAQDRQVGAGQRITSILVTS